MTTKTKSKRKPKQPAQAKSAPEPNEKTKSGRYYGHVAVFEVLEDNTYRLVAGGTELAGEQFADAAAAEAWIRDSGTENRRTLQVGRLFMDKKFTVQSVVETKTVVQSV